MPRSSLYIPTLLAGMIFTVSFLNPVYSARNISHRAPATLSGASGRSACSIAYHCSGSFPCQDMQCVENCSDPDPRNHVLYEQPVWQTLQMFRPSIPFSSPTLTLTLLLVGEMLCQSFTFWDTSSILVRFSPTSFAFIIGFLPVLYTWLNTRRNPAPVFLPSEPDQDEAKPAPPSQELRGWKLLLLWFPAACDLTGTTVRNSLFPRSTPPSSITIIESY